MEVKNKTMYHIQNTDKFKNIWQVGNILTISDKFNSNTSRIKKRNGSVYDWWSRSVQSANYVRHIRQDGSDANRYANSSLGVALGFCTN